MQAAADAILQNHWAILAQMTPVERLLLNAFGALLMMFSVAVRPEPARVRRVLSVVMRPLRLLQYTDPVAVELISFGALVGFVLYVWYVPTELRAQWALKRVAHYSSWIGWCAVAIAAQIASWIRWRYDERSLVLLLTAGWWFWVAYCFARAGFLSVLIAIPWIALMCLKGSQVVDRLGREHGGT